MYQNNFNGYYNPQPQSQTQLRTPTTMIAQGLKGRPVSSLEEAKAAPIDFDGSIFFFPDIANKKIYTKQINLDGTASLNMYEYKETPIVDSNYYITREEFNATLLEIKKMFEAIQQSPKEEVVVQEKYNF